VTTVKHIYILVITNYSNSTK